jgi:UDP-N-acetylmuramoylalanine--D-glutamate ligase
LAVADYRYEDGAVFFRRNGAQASVSLAGTMFANPILGQSGAAAVAAMAACGVTPDVVVRAARRFESLPHRMRQVAEVRGIRFVDDSKATTLAALEAALQMSDGPVRLIAGGLLKEHDVTGVKEMLVNKTRGVYLMGQASGKLAGAWGDAVVCRECGTLDRAVRVAWAEARAGEIVLLAPGCASFDQFKNYEDRGNQFIAIVRSFHEE